MMSSTENIKLDKLIRWFVDYWYPARVDVEVRGKKKSSGKKKNRRDLGASSENEK